MIIFVYTVYVMVCLFLIAVVLLQSGKGADLASAFGAGGSQAAIGARSAATALSRLTTWSAIAFMVLSLALAVLKSRDLSVMDKVTTPAPPAAAAPAPGTAPNPAGVPPAPTGTIPAAGASGEPTLLPESPVPPAAGDIVPPGAPAEAPAPTTPPASGQAPTAPPPVQP